MLVADVCSFQMNTQYPILRDAQGLTLDYFFGGKSPPVNAFFVFPCAFVSETNEINAAH